MWFTQILTYGIILWLVFTAIAFVAARIGGGWGIIVGQVVIAMIVVLLDWHWVIAGTHGSTSITVPDHDAIFMLGAVFRAFLINTCLLPISLFGLLLSPRWV